MVVKDVKSRVGKEAGIETAAFRMFIRHGFRKVTMGDIAEACGISRPSLYAVFPNKEAIFASLVRRHTRETLAATEENLEAKEGVRGKLEYIFNVWIIEPFAAVMESENAYDLSTCAPDVAREAKAAMWNAIEAQVADTLRADAKKKHAPAVTELAHILTLAAKGAKIACETLPELRRMFQGLIGMTIAALEKLNGPVP